MAPLPFFVFFFLWYREVICGEVYVGCDVGCAAVGRWKSFFFQIFETRVPDGLRRR
jgi:hypothetical protein